MLSRLAEIRQRQISTTNKRDPPASMGVGGVLGAKAFFPDLDISVAMRLDLCVYDINEEFVKAIDPALVASDNPSISPVLVLHHTRDVRPRLSTDAMGRNGSYEDTPWFNFFVEMPVASAVDCFADSIELGNVAEAREFAFFMARQSTWR